MITIAGATKGLIGQICWGVEWDPQFSLSLSFGSPKMFIDEPHATKAKSPRVQELAAFRKVTVKGEWWLWIFCAHWKLVIPNRVTARNSSPLHLKKRAIACLDGQRLVDLHVNLRNGETEFCFDLGASLQARRWKLADSDIWTLYKPNGYVVGLGGDGTFTHAKRKTPQDQVAPIKLQPLKLSAN